MTETDEHRQRCDDLWRRALAMGRARWMPGMLALRYAPGYRDHRQPEGRLCSGRWAPPTAMPDWDDPATVGCLLALVRERLGDPGASVQLRGWGTATALWQVFDSAEDPVSAMCGTEAEALLRALVPEEADDD